MIPPGGVHSGEATASIKAFWLDGTWTPNCLCCGQRRASSATQLFQLLIWVPNCTCVVGSQPRPWDMFLHKLRRRPLCASLSSGIFSLVSSRCNSIDLQILSPHFGKTHFLLESHVPWGTGKCLGEMSDECGWRTFTSLLSLFQGLCPLLCLLLLAADAFKPLLLIFNMEFTTVISRKVSPIKAMLPRPKRFSKIFSWCAVEVRNPYKLRRQYFPSCYKIIFVTSTS